MRVLVANGRLDQPVAPSSFPAWRFRELAKPIA